MADVPVNPASPDPLEAAEAQDSALEAPAAEPEVPAEAAVPPVEAEASAPEEAPTTPPAVAAPSIAATLEAPPMAAGTGGSGSVEGGEWDLLVRKVRAFFDGGELQAWWDQLGGPLRGLGLLIGLFFVLRLYDALLDTLDDLPLMPRLLQLAGLIALVRFALTRLVRTEERQALLNDWQARWQRFRG